MPGDGMLFEPMRIKVLPRNFKGLPEIGSIFNSNFGMKNIPASTKNEHDMCREYTSCRPTLRFTLWVHS